MSFVSIRMITEDVRRLVTFYERVTGATASWATEEFAEVRTSTATVAVGSPRTVAALGPGAARPGSNGGVLVEFLVDDVDEVRTRLGAWLDDVVMEPTTMPWGNRSLVVRDPDGTLVNLFTPVTEAAVAKFAGLRRRDG